ncbi:MAG: efflux RND transporter permease subunit [gamma proteobacterium symbiont of Bathyaustriella thionipta]|nr:efflux RND transporter permease subunit [gamma proteobacterium symbiont of Bathyaustriella thionipta]MCU7951343.1 efflux RND transporter permease subunit [gamma proteobacterium symbiont of Bathyaustriella thionipta]MCU7953666.1 efflux RND transporter permease subunit [gamma proteobacterium symbiont of Bathyaustriella thionipta]MCU7957898.1 efflux RND transporter permease subunit [gamma proteobacterium symbiont of Bathyaustriella thionipta]MCU7966830.1 efflux RND transporter permease subunit 
MDIIKYSLYKPVTITVAILLILIFGLLALQKLPLQLTPNVTEAKISVVTAWPGASPREIEQDIIEEQELVLKNTPGLIIYEAKAQDNLGTITLTFKLGTNIEKALLDVSNKLTEVDNYPLNVEKPIIKATGESSSPVIWTMLRTLPDNPNDIDTYKTYLENQVREHYERVPGVAELFMLSGTKQQMQITLDVNLLAKYKLTIDDIINKVKRHNQDVSAGSIDIDRRNYRIRTTAQFRDIQSIQELILITDADRQVKLKDVAVISYGYAVARAFSAIEGVKGLIIGVKPENNTNIVELSNQVELVVNQLNSTMLKEMGLHIDWLHDKRHYIQGAIDLVQKNILIGGALAIMVLLLFLRTISSTTVVALAIPISIIATFIILHLMGRSLNTISLAGISFSVGMLVDSAIVVLENIDRHKKMGKAFFKAAYDGTNEVWGALIASALTTIAVFVPIIFLQNEAGQLFKDIAIAVTAAVSFSLFVSISVIPMLWHQLMRLHPNDTHIEAKKKSIIVGMGTWFSDLFMTLICHILATRGKRLLTILCLTLLSGLSVYSLFPKTEYLPQGNRNLFFNIMIPPPGLSYQEKKSIGDEIYQQLKPHIHQSVDGYPAVERLFYVASGDFMIFGVIAEDDSRIKELKPLLIPIVNNFPGIFGITKQAGVFEQGLGKGRTIDIDISGEQIDIIANAGAALFGAIKKAIPKAQIRPIPSIELLYPEVLLQPNHNQLQRLEMDSLSLGIIADVLLQGRKIGEFKSDGVKKIDMILKTDQTSIQSPEDLYHSLVATPSGHLVGFDTLADLQQTNSISEIRHYNGKRTITLEVTPPQEMTLQEGMELLQQEVFPELKQDGQLSGVNIALSGTTDKLTETIDSMVINLILAIVITYLLMSALFANFIYPLIILFTLPLAAAGGFIGLALTNLFRNYSA